jgi:hypothetical protein
MCAPAFSANACFYLAGKSFLLNLLIDKYNGPGVFVTASTGLAAVNIGGTTLHSFAGVGLGTDKVADLIKTVGAGAAAKRWRECKLLIIDESMRVFSCDVALLACALSFRFFVFRQFQ